MNFKRLDKVFSEYIRRRDADDNGYVKCCTCPTVKHWKEMQAGHYIPRGYYNVRFNEKNTHSQCSLCNEGKKGNLRIYEKFMFTQYGELEVSRLEYIKHTEWKLVQHEIDELTEYYKNKIKQL